MPFPKRPRRADAPPLSDDEALLKLEQFCAFRERSPKEVREKAASLGLHGEAAEKVLESLRADKFFDEVRFAAAYASGKFRSNHWGRVRIRRELRLREIDPDVIERALGDIDEAEYTGLLRQLLAKRRAELERRADDQAREKAAATLIRAGFEPDLVFRYL
jgi:regulatory protein